MPEAIMEKFLEEILNAKDFPTYKNKRIYYDGVFLKGINLDYYIDKIIEKYTPKTLNEVSKLTEITLQVLRNHYNEDLSRKINDKIEGSNALDLELLKYLTEKNIFPQYSKVNNKRVLIYEGKTLNVSTEDYIVLLLKKLGPLSRQKIVEKLNLSRTSVFEALPETLEIIESNNGSRGRPTKLFRLIEKAQNQ